MGNVVFVLQMYIYAFWEMLSTNASYIFIVPSFVSDYVKSPGIEPMALELLAPDSNH